MNIAVIDNYDSFVHNIVHYLESIQNVNVTVFLNDAFNLDDLQRFDKIVLSPGPGIPSEAGLLLQVIDQYKESKPILGICLGHQAIGEYFGCTLKNLNEPLHGTSSKLNIITEDYLFKKYDNSNHVGHYHSWVISNENFSPVLEILALDIDNNIMAIKHKLYDIRGVQFHPESILTDNGITIIENWLNN